jgi:hypothetical protein
MSEYILNTDNDQGELQEIKKEEFSGVEADILVKVEELAKLCQDNNIPCFLTTKFESQEDPSAAWYFGDDTVKAHGCFVENFAPLMLHITSKMTLTKVTAVNPETGQQVYEVSPSLNDEK